MLPGEKESSAHVPTSLCPLPSAHSFTGPDVTSTSPREQGVAETSNPMRVISLFVTFDTNISLMILATSRHTSASLTTVHQTFPDFLIS